MLPVVYKLILKVPVKKRSSSRSNLEVKHQGQVSLEVDLDVRTSDLTFNLTAISWVLKGSTYILLPSSGAVEGWWYFKINTQLHPKKITEKHVVSVSFAFFALSDKWKSKWTHSLIENKLFASIYSFINGTSEAIFSLENRALQWIFASIINLWQFYANSSQKFMVNL